MSNGCLIDFIYNVGKLLKRKEKKNLPGEKYGGKGGRVEYRR